MAFPWYASDFPPSKMELATKDCGETKNFRFINSVKNIFVKSTNLSKPDAEDVSITNIHTQDDFECDSRYHSGIINKAFLPMRVTLMALGRWPFAMKRQSVLSKNQYNNKHRFLSTRITNYDSGLKSPLWLYFGLTTAFMFFVLVMSTLGFLEFFLNWQILPGSNHHHPRNQKNCSNSQSIADEKDIFRHNLVMFLLVWGCLVHGTVSSLSFWINRKRFVKVLNFWNVVVDEVVIDEVKSHRRFLIASNLGYLLFLILIYFAYSSWKIPLVRDSALLFGLLSIKPLLSENYELACSDQWKFRVFGIIMMIYAVYTSRAFLFMFCFKCRLLRSLFRVWNARLLKFLKRSENDLIEDKNVRDMLENKECQQLLKHMALLLKMLKLTDKMFATVLQAYYAVQLLNMCFELYMLAKSGSKEFTRNDDSGLDVVTAVVTLIQNVYFFFTVSLDGSYVGEEAAKGLNALRCNFINPQSSIHRKYLIYNLGIIYNQKIAVTGGKFFTIDRPFIITVLGAVLTYFVIILQIEPSLNKGNPHAPGE